MSECICDYPEDCNGAGVLYCEGCGGDFCVCAACGMQGEAECFGCDSCDAMQDDWDDEPLFPAAPMPERLTGGDHE